MPSIFLYFATVRRAISTPSFESSRETSWSLSGFWFFESQRISLSLERRFFVERVDPRTGREEPYAETPGVAPMDRPTATAKYNEIIDLVLQEARKKVEAAGKK